MDISVTNGVLGFQWDHFSDAEIYTLLVAASNPTHDAEGNDRGTAYRLTKTLLEHGANPWARRPMSKTHSKLKQAHDGRHSVEDSDSVMGGDSEME
jgi:hypothetical protein